MNTATTTDISSFTPEQPAAFKSAASLSGGQAQYTTTPPPPVSQPPAVTPPQTTTPTAPPAPAQNTPGTPTYNPTGGAPLNTPATTTAPIGGTDSAGAPLLSDQADRQALAQTQAAFQAQATQVQNTITNIQNGTTPLSVAEQAQVDGLKAQFQTLIDQQTLTNTGASGTANIRGYQTGAAEYDPTFQAKTIGALVSAGQAKVADLQTKEAAAVASLTQSIKDNDIAAAKNAWDIYQTAYQDRQKALQDTISATQAAIKDAQDQAAKAAEQQKEDQKTYFDQVQKPLQDIAQTAAKYGATADVIAQINQAQSVEDGINIAGKYMQDPKAQMELESARLDNILKQQDVDNAPADRALDRSLKQAQLANAQATTAKTRAETAQIGQPTAADIKQQKADVEAAKTTIPVLQDKIGLINNLIDAPGLAGSVGPNPLARSAPDFDFFTGVRGNFIAGINQLTNQETLTTLLNLKAQGGTLGALSDSEGDLLRQAASKIGSWAIKDKNGNVTGYNTTETAMKEELATLKNVAQRALDRAQGTVLPQEDQSALDALYGNKSGSSTTDLQGFQPANYY